MKGFVLVGLSTVALGAAVALLPGNAFAQSTMPDTTPMGDVTGLTFDLLSKEPLAKSGCGACRQTTGLGGLLVAPAWDQQHQRPWLKQYAVEK